MSAVRRIAALLWAVQTMAWGQPPAQGDQSELIRALMARIDKLEKRVEELEGRGAPVESPAKALAKAAEAPSPGPGASAHQMHDVVMAEAQRDYPSLKIAGFSDINFSASDLPGSRSGFSEGQFILHLTSALSPRVFYFGELSMTARPDAGTGRPPVPGFNVEVERSLIRFDQSDRLKISFGRYHTPINYWNNTFHHGAWLQTSISRPEMAQFGGSFIPVHFVGGLMEGAVPAGGMNLNYNFGVGNGRGDVISRGGDFGDANNNRALLVNAFVKPDRLFGMQVGGSVYRDKINEVGGMGFRELITAAHFAWTRETPEIIAEFANVAHSPIGGSGTFNSQGLYAQIAYRLPAFQRLLKPYYRYERIRIPSADKVFAAVPGLDGSIFGLRYDISNFAALKWEYRRTSRPGLNSYNGAYMQTSFTF